MDVGRPRGIETAVDDDDFIFFIIFWGEDWGKVFILCCLVNQGFRVDLLITDIVIIHSLGIKIKLS